MTTFKKRFIAALSAGSMFLSLATPVLAENTIIISGNGANTTNEAEVELDNDTNVVQNNNAQVYNNVSSNSSTGGNSASMNTGGEVLVSTGDATTDVSIENILNSNRALVDCCNQNDLDIEISDNGYESDNKVKMEADETDGSDINVYQDNYANVRNNVDADARTGHNDADYNTGGDVAVVTGDATTLVDVSTIANANWARVGSNGQGGEVSARIIGNGANTTNEIELELDDDILLVQDNNARISNDVDADAKTGKNDANMNTGGDVVIMTGDAKVDVEVDNMVNFNYADVDCGCIEDLLLKIAGNGYEADSTIDLDLDNDLDVYQDNNWCARERRWNPALDLFDFSEIYEGRHDRDCGTDVDADAKTGENDADYNTGDEHGGDPAVLTGDAWSFVDVGNSGNVNAFGDDAPELPWDFDFHFSLDLDLEDLLALLH